MYTLGRRSPAFRRRIFLGAVAAPLLPRARPWPQFLNNGSGSLAEGQSLPLDWSDTNNIAWRAPVAGYGQSSAVASGNTVFATSVDGPLKEDVLVSAFDLTTGSRAWTSRHESGQRIKDSDMVSKAAPTPAAGAEAVFAFFETGNVLAIDHQGTVLWERRLTEEFGEFGGRHGIGSSVRLCEAGLLVLVAHDRPSYLICLDRASGQTVWKADRPTGPSWSTPSIARHGGAEMAIVIAGGAVEAYDTRNGTALWTLEGFDGAFIASPAPIPGGCLIGSSSKGRSAAIRFGETAAAMPEVIWRPAEASSYFSSPLVHDGRAYMVNKAGVAFCVRADTGEELWHARLEGQCWASAVGLRDRVYFFGVDGTTTVVKSGDTFSVLASNALSAEGRLYGATVADDSLLLRFGREIVRVKA